MGKLRYIFYFIVITSLTGWYTYGTLISTEKSIPPEVMPYYENFLMEAKNRNIDLSQKPIIIEFSDDLIKTEDYHQYAYCTFFPTPKIQISKEFWFQASALGREIVLYHEMTHCLWFKEHTSENNIHLMNGFMSPTLVSLYTRFKDKVLDDNFDESKYSYKPIGVFVEMIKTSLVFKFFGALLVMALILSIYKQFKNRRKNQDSN
jgi:hypothetical protein